MTTKKQQIMRGRVAAAWIVAAWIVAVGIVSSLLAAAQAQLDNLTATGQSISEEDFKQLWPKINMTTKQSDGTGQWEGMKLVEVAVNGMSFDTPVKVKLSRYIIIENSLAIQEQ